MYSCKIWAFACGGGLTSERALLFPRRDQGASEGTKVPKVPKCNFWREDCFFQVGLVAFLWNPPTSQQGGPSCSQPPGNFKQNPSRFPFPYEKLHKSFRQLRPNQCQKAPAVLPPTGPARPLRPVHGMAGVCQRRIGSLAAVGRERGRGSTFFWCIG